MKILVTGGNGFLGSEVCRVAAEMGHEVTSISRSGRPQRNGSWVSRVNWIAANVLDPETWREHLQGIDAVIHAIGILREHSENGLTYERLNGDSTEMVAWEAEHAGVPRFVYISSYGKPPFLPQRFIDSKRRAEAALRGRNIRESILRPALIYGDTRPSTSIGASTLQTLSHVPGLKHSIHRYRPLHVTQVALAAVRAATEEGYEGTINIDNIEYLAGDQWKTFLEPRQQNRYLKPVLIGGVVVAAAALTLPLVRSRTVRKPSANVFNRLLGKNHR